MATVMLIWRQNPHKLTQIMLDSLRYSKKTQFLVKSNTSSTIHAIFTEKDSIYTFCDQVTRLLNLINITMTQYQGAILDALKIKFQEKKIIIPPIKEFNAYNKMITVAISDWGNVPNYVQSMVLDQKMNQKHFIPL